MYKIAIMTMALAAIAAPAAAQRVTLAVSGGTLGVGPEIGYRFSDHLGLRGSAGFLGISHGFSSDDIDYHGKVKLESYGAMVDLYPWGGHFRISAGGRINKNRAHVDATPGSTTEIGDHSYTPSEIGTLNGHADTKDFAPALTLGWSGANRSGFMFGLDAGVLFQGKVRIRQFTATGTAASNPIFQADLEQERQSLQDDVDDYKVYPLVQISLGYRF